MRNGDKFLIDIGAGSAERISSLQIPYDYLEKVFIGHLHADHFGAMGELFIGGAPMGRHLPLRIWGPSGPVPEPGTQYAIDGPVSYSLEWNGLKFVFSSDTYPNTWFNEYALDADLAIHECFVAVPAIVTKMGFSPEAALIVETQVHTAPEAFGKVMATIEPRMAVAYQFFKDFDTTADVHCEGGPAVRRPVGAPRRVHCVAPEKRNTEK